MNTIKDIICDTDIGEAIAPNQLKMLVLSWIKEAGQEDICEIDGFIFERETFVTFLKYFFDIIMSRMIKGPCLYRWR